MNSALYVECGARKISFNGHIYTKSSFLGVSVAVHNIGKIKLTVQNFKSVNVEGIFNKLMLMIRVMLMGPGILCFRQRQEDLKKRESILDKE